jgi:hypothetical protein
MSKEEIEIAAQVSTLEWLKYWTYACLSTHEEFPDHVELAIAEKLYVVVNKSSESTQQLSK